LQQTFGHVEYILRHERYAHLRESDKDISQLCPLKRKEALSVFSELLADICSMHPSPYVHIGGDETYLLGHCRDCQSKVTRDGKSKLYADYLKKVADCVIALGKRPLLWADMLLRHPEAMGEMPRGCIFVDWNYGWQPDHFGDVSRIQQNGFEVWGAAALRSHPDNHSLVTWKTHFDNIKDFVPHARRHRYAGMLMTSWSTSGDYGLEWDQRGEVTAMHSVRHVYPLAGFRILLAAYAESLQQEDPIDPKEFVKRYAAARFGLSARDGAKLWQALTLNDTNIKPSVDIGPILVAARKAKDLVASLDPQQHRSEFEHFRLMASLREFHVRFKQLEREAHSTDFTRAQVSEKILALERLIEECEMLDQQFIKANRGFLYEEGLAEEIKTRSKELQSLYDRFTRAGRKGSKVSLGQLKFQRGWSWSTEMKRQPVETGQTALPSLTVQ
jgi:hexosaminidase